MRGLSHKERASAQARTFTILPSRRWPLSCRSAGLLRFIAAPLFYHIPPSLPSCISRQHSPQSGLQLQLLQSTSPFGLTL